MFLEGDPSIFAQYIFTLGFRHLSLERVGCYESEVTFLVNLLTNRQTDRQTSVADDVVIV